MRFVHFNPGTAAPIQPLDSHWASSSGTFIKAIVSCHGKPICTYVYVNSSEGAFIKAIPSCPIEPTYIYVYVNSSEGNAFLKSAFLFGDGGSIRMEQIDQKSAFIKAILSCHIKPPMYLCNVNS